MQIYSITYKLCFAMATETQTYRENKEHNK